MGFAKEMDIEEGEAGFSGAGLRVACVACVNDAWLANHVCANGTAGDCDFCGTTSPTTMFVHDLFLHMSRCLQREHRPSSLSDNVPGAEWEIRAPSLSSTDILDLLGEPLGEHLAEAFVDAFRDDWVAEGVWTGDPGDWLSEGWDRFVQEVKHERRFVFLRPTATEASPFAPYEIEPSDMLDRLQQIFDECTAVIPFPAGQSMVRGRKHAPDEVLTRALELGSPPADKATSQRMSPAGISFFYAAADEETALAELRGIEGEVATTCGWITRRSSHLLDLARVPSVPSIFDESLAHMRPTVRFLRRFVDEIAKPVVAHDNPDVDYVPTQVVAEFIRHLVRADSGDPVEGVMYPSAVKPGRTNFALFPPPNADEPLVVLHDEPTRHRAASATTTWAPFD